MAQFGVFVEQLKGLFSEKSLPARVRLKMRKSIDGVREKKEVNLTNELLFLFSTYL